MSRPELHRYTLPNGLRVVLAPDRSRPVAGVSVHYDVGFRSEPRGRTGFAHLFEHLMFQGSESLAKLEHIRYVEASGGACNGSTRQDWTEYHQVLPAAALERVLFCEADRMRAPRLTEENLRNQIAVVKEEIRLNVLNRPYGGFPWLLLPPVLYRTFPNAHNGYGDFTDLDRATVQDCAAFFDAYYGPGNAVLTITGDADPEAAARLVERHFGDVPARPVPTRVPLAEPVPDGPRRAAHADPHAPLPALAVGYRLPDPVAELEGYLAAFVLAEVLTGGETARLRERLVLLDGLAIDVRARCGLLEALTARDPDTFVLTARHPAEVDPDRLLAAVDEELAKLANDGPDAAELAGVTARAAGSLFAEQDRPAERTLGYGTAELLLGDAGWAADLPHRIREVTAGQVAAAAAALRPESRAVLTLVPGERSASPAGLLPGGSSPAGSLPTGSLPGGEGRVLTAGTHRDAETIGRTPAGPRPVPGLAVQRPVPPPTMVDTVLDTGLRVIAARSPSVPMVHARMRIPFPGTEPDFPATAELLAASLLDGTRRRGRAELDAVLAAVGANLAAARDPLWLRLSGRVLSGGLDTLLQTLAEVLTEPGYPAPEVTRERDLLVERLAVERAEPRAIAREALQRYRYGDHPIAAELPQPDAVAVVDPDRVRALHERAASPAGSVLVLVGDLDPDRATAAVAAAMAGWCPGAAAGELPPVPADRGGGVQLVHRPGAVQAQIRLCAPAVGRGSGRYPALRLANLVFSGYFSSRLVANLREDKGFTYGARSRIESTRLAASLLVETETATAVTAPALAEIRRELDRLVTDPPGTAEVEAARQYAMGALLTSLDTQAELASVISGLVGEGLDPGWLVDHQDWLGAVTVAEVAEAAREFFPPAGASGVVVGDATVLADPLQPPTPPAPKPPPGAGLV
jgi:predicted Zn-dependent peptidase